MADNLILIGMPGAGKSTVGVLLAKQQMLDFLDTDLLIQRQTGLRLQHLIKLRGLHSFRRTEEEMLLNLDVAHSVISTGGSVIYSTRGMEHLRQLGTLIYLHISLPLLTCRMADMGERGVVIEPGQSFADLYAERTPLYHRYADLEIDTDDLGIEEVLKKIEDSLKKG